MEDDTHSGEAKAHNSTLQEPPAPCEFPGATPPKHLQVETDTSAPKKHGSLLGEAPATARVPNRHLSRAMMFPCNCVSWHLRFSRLYAPIKIARKSLTFVNVGPVIT